ncbi:ubiquinone/menaquinone biosynthesis C-methylase UbiE [Methanohalophilus levihalophilus]|uniref:class I SAM-dependent methyltransferase n=1 Tax=Methanohalophilus levihalophilus TaxID=1431282 RepID=UPI001AEA40BA|nr:class I SAM-dependent methyltransferase [Methanohalophilus levihalophilus]MBP2029507.1 ubiquinone/menaquinone biosynthesis C-methylase UbiE [Methanohalophilus levihalophilus]
MDQPDWYYDEFVQAGVDYTDIEQVINYDENMKKMRDVKEETKDILELLHIKPNYLVIEIGCGTGEFSIEIAKRCQKVFAIDISNEMIKYAHRKAKSRNVENIEFHNAGFLTYEHDGEKADAVVSQLVLHHLPDFWKIIALKRIHSMLKDGGQFYLKDVVYSPETNEYENFLFDAMEAISEKAGEETIKEIKTHIREEFSTFEWVMEGLLERAGFQIKLVDYQDDFMADYLCVKK